MGANVDLYMEKFEIYLNKGKEAFHNGNIEAAKKNYYAAAENLLKAAKESSPKLRETRVARAKNIIEIADNLTVEPKKKAGNKDSDENADKKIFEAASIPDIHFSDIAGLEDVKKAITLRMINPIKYPDKYELYNKKTGGGVLLYGPPGTGKTMIAKAIACEVGATFYAIKGSDIVSKWVGESEQNISALFETARKDPLAIIFIDEMDSLIGTRGVDTHNDKRVNEFLQQIDGFVGRNPNLLLLGATNRPWDIDGAAMRSGRFSQKICVGLPDDKAREFLLKKSIKNIPLADDVNINELVKLTKGYSGADIDELCDRAKDNPLLRSIESNTIVLVTKNDFLKALKEVKPTVDEKEIAKFIKYAGEDIIKENGDKEPITASDNSKEIIKEDIIIDDLEEILVKETNITLVPNKEERIEFALKKSYESIYICINKHNYVCHKDFTSWISDPLKELNDGTYKVEVFADKKIGEFDINISSGIEEIDMGI